MAAFGANVSGDRRDSYASLSHTSASVTMLSAEAADGAPYPWLHRQDPRGPRKCLDIQGEQSARDSTNAGHQLDDVHAFAGANQLSEKMQIVRVRMSNTGVEHHTFRP